MRDHFTRSDTGESMRKLGTSTKKQKNRVNKSYQRFFDGYAEVVTEKPDGKGFRTERIYVADYHAAKLGSGKKRTLRLAYFCMLALSLILFCMGGLQNTGFNMSWYSAIPQFCVVIGLSVCFVTFLFRYLPKTGNMTNWEYKVGPVRFVKWTLYTACAFAACALAALISIPFYPGEWKAALMAVTEFLGGALVLMVIRGVEQGIDYECIPSGLTAPIGSVLVSSMKVVTPPKKKTEDGEEEIELEFTSDDDYPNSDLKLF